MNIARLAIVSVPLALSLAACTASGQRASGPAGSGDGWTVLFDGGDPSAHLRGYRRADFPAEWKVEDGALVLRGKGGDIVTKDQYADFEFQVEWKVAPGGNSGIMWHVSEEFGAPWETGPEMQVLDDERHNDGKSRLTSAGACYALYAAPAGAVKPAGEWNVAYIKAVGPKVVYRLNGVTTAEFDMSSKQWKDRVAGSKFASMPNFGTRPVGHIAIQDHGDVVMFRNMRVRSLGGVAAPAPAPTPAPAAAPAPAPAPAAAPAPAPAG
jgi:hypothetical protein